MRTFANPWAKAARIAAMTLRGSNRDSSSVSLQINMGVSAEAASLSVEDLSTALAEPQWRCRGRYDMAMARGFGVILERIGHTDELGVVPCAPQKLDIDRLP